MEKTAVEWLLDHLEKTMAIGAGLKYFAAEIIEQAKEMEEERMIKFAEFIIDELEPMSQNRDWVEERYNYFKSE